MTRLWVALFLALSAVLPLNTKPAVYGAGSEGLGPAAVQANNDDELVYLDGAGVIKVFDPQVATGAPEVVWQSPTGGWKHFALGDFNADGDAEIVAVSSQGTNRLAVYDPVAEGVDPDDADGLINGIPWELLYEVTLTGPPLLVDTGNFDLDSPVDEIVYYYTLPKNEVVQEDDVHRFVFLAADGSPPDGTTWSQILTYDSGNAWTWVGSGNLNGTGVDEIALINRVVGNLSVYTIANDTLDRLLRHSNLQKAWQDGDIGQFIAGGDAELAAGRETVYDLPALFVMRYNGGSWKDEFEEYFDPPPEAVFMGDLTGNGDDEVIVLRLVPSSLGKRARLFVRDNGNDSIGMGEEFLDGDNGYRTGVAGDVDGDGRDEIVIMRNDRIRTYTEPEKSSNFVDEPASTGSGLILAGNLDANGLTGSSRLGASPDSVTDSVVSGSVSESHALSLSDFVNGRSIPFSYSVEDGSAWIQVTRSASSTPATLDVSLDATKLISGTFSDRIIIETSDASVINAPYAIDVDLTVKPGVALSPSSILDLQDDCGSGDSNTAYKLDVQGTAGAAYTVTQQSPVAWASVSPFTGTIPSQVILQLDGDELASGLGSTELVVRAKIGDELAIANADVTLLCVESTVFLPYVTE